MTPWDETGALLEVGNCYRFSHQIIRVTDFREHPDLAGWVSVSNEDPVSKEMRSFGWPMIGQLAGPVPLTPMTCPRCPNLWHCTLSGDLRHAA